MSENEWFSHHLAFVPPSSLTMKFFFKAKRKAKELKWRTFSLSFTVFVRSSWRFFFFSFETMQTLTSRAGVWNDDERRNYRRNEKININKIAEERGMVEMLRWTVRRARRRTTREISDESRKWMWTKREEFVDFCSSIFSTFKSFPRLVGVVEAFELDRQLVFVKYANSNEATISFSAQRKSSESIPLLERKHSLKIYVCDFSSEPSKSTGDDHHHLC